MKVFLIGAGFTHAVFPDCPLNGDVISTLRKLHRLGPCARLAEAFGSDDIEISLTRLDVSLADRSIDADSREELRQLRLKVETELANFFSAFVLSEEMLAQRPWLTESLLPEFQLGDVAISLNYDCVLESALDLVDLWTPNGGYPGLMSAAFQGDAQSAVTVLKIHGSCSFIIAPALDNPDVQSIGFLVNEHFFPKSGRNRHLNFGGGLGRRYLIAPSYVKVPTIDIYMLMRRALDSVKEADKLIVIGCSLRQEDTFLRLLITQFFSVPSWKDRECVFRAKLTADSV